MKGPSIVVLMIAIALTPLMSAQDRDQTGAPVTVSVIDPSGAAVGNACVTVIEHSHDHQFTRETDDGGKLAVTLSAGSYDFTVTAPGFNKTMKHVELASATPASLKIELPVGTGGGVEVTSVAPLNDAYEGAGHVHTPSRCAIPISIRVIDPTKNPIARACVTVKDPSDKLKLAQLTDAIGSLPVTLDPGSYDITAMSPGFSNITIHFEVSSSSPETVQVVMPVGVSSSTPNILPGPVPIQTQKDWIADTPCAATSATDIKDFIAISIRVVDPANCPVPNANVRIENRSGNISVSKETDANGLFSVALSSGEYQATATAAGFTKTVEQLEVTKSSPPSFAIKMAVGTHSGLEVTGQETFVVEAPCSDPTLHK